MSTIADITESAAAPSTEAQPSKLSQLEQLLKQGRVHLQDLRARVEQATKERDELAARLEERDASHEKLWAEQAEMQRADSERHERELLELRAELSEASAARDVACARHEELEGKRAALEQLAKKIFETFSK